ncbi:asparagine synthase (glutamine-hydrolyzing) [Catenuloplanes atrovinosus]|uniref:asparagine synthase (glutamine-hydrolyzing) n=1 Tax=Catenuloplanes atrovinosus TaxID=137266 RepID=A0AAE3YN78_9ACTN|nr:asparagine synthase (glutamine-hydrolyzing) [Catenuloplanes atrovinosus]MDR7276620.1 asparagine synthase (glutamine-hydrolyzing) [Catenuloplanes atrovinosus]
MCGIVGWVDFARDLTAEHATIRAMTATMALRGPDDEGVWLDESVALGHRRLAVIDIPGGTQPMTVRRDGTVTAVLTYSGEVYNFRELRTELRGHGHPFRTDSDTEVLLRAYLQWGDRFVERLRGIFAFGLWDHAHQRLILGRDRIGVKPLYYRPTPHGLLFASEPKAILAHPTVTAEVDPDGLRELLTHFTSPGRTPYRDMYDVRPGQLIITDRTGVRHQRYWSLHTDEHPDDLPTTVRTVRQLLEEAVTEQLIADVPLCTLLSGGLDSSTLTAIAAGSPTTGSRIRTYAIDFAGQTENFRPDAVRDAPDTPFVHDVVAHLGGHRVEHRDIVLDTAMMMDPLHRTGVLLANDLPTPMGDMYQSLYLLFRAVREHSTVALSGEVADEVFGGYWWFHDRSAIANDTFPWLFPRHPAAGGGNPIVELLDPGLAALLDLPGYQADRYRDALAEVDHLPGEDPWERRMREVSYLAQIWWVPFLLARKDRMSMAHGLEVRVPFADHRLLEYVYRVPWSMKFFDGQEKSLLRAAVADLLPDSVLQRRKSPYPSTQDVRYERMLRARAGEILADPAAPSAGLLNVPALTELFRSPLESSGFGPRRRSAELVVGLDDWLRRYPVRLRLS